ARRSGHHNRLHSWVVAQVEQCLWRATGGGSRPNRSGRERPTSRWNGLCGRGLQSAADVAELRISKDQVSTTPDLPDVYSVAEIARAAGARRADVRALAGSGLIRPLTPAGY